MNDLLIDTNEPREVYATLNITGSPVSLTPLNSDGYADYRWRTVDGRVKQIERKTWGELLSNPDKVEEQLLRHLSKHPSVELVFLLEGLAEQNTRGGSTVINKQKNGYFTKGHDYTARLSGIYAWLYEVSKYCQIIQTPSLDDTIIALHAMYKGDQKESHQTFHRHIKQLDFNPDPRVMTLMGIANGFGDVRATALIKNFISPWNIMSAGFCEHSVVKNKYDLTKVHGVGKTIVDNVLRNFGRPDV